MKTFFVFVLIAACCFWIYMVPLNGHLPLLSKLKSSTVMQITSNAFTNGGNIPDRYSCKGENVNPELEFSGISNETRSLALIMDDPDAPSGTFSHWVVFNMPPDTRSISEASVDVPGVQGKNGTGQRFYTGPCPPSGTHRYFFKLYALDTTLNADDVTDRGQLISAMSQHILDHVELMGLYGK